MNNSIIEMTGQIGGFFRIDAVRLDAAGEEVGRRNLAPWQSNLITNSGMEQLKTGAETVRNYCHVGTGSAVPAFTDTVLQTWRASTNTLNGAEARGLVVTPAYYYYARRVYRFATGAASGNLSEVGLAAAGSSSSALFARALIRDSGGNPTTITVLPDEVLDVTYEVRVYVDTADVSGSVVLGGVTYTTTCRRAMLEGSNPYTNRFLQGQWFQSNFSNESGTMVYTGTLGPVTGKPSGTEGINVYNAGGTTAAGPAGSYYMDTTSTWQLDQGNLAGGIRSYVPGSQFGAFQIQFDPVVPKDATKRLTLTFRWSWERYTP